MRRFFYGRALVLLILLAVVLIGFLVFSVFVKKAPEIIKENLVEIISDPRISTIGLSVEGRKIQAYTYGKGKNQLAFVGGIHGGYEWNTIILAYKFIDYLKLNPGIIPENVTITVIPNLNPDGTYKVIGKEGGLSLADIPTGKDLSAGRFNARQVDINRNFDCKWQAKSTWRSNPVSAGTMPFSEPEAKALQNFVMQNNLQTVVFWHSQSNGVYASECLNGILPETTKIMNTYSQASGYPAINTFDSYVITGDADSWLASINIPAISVELKTHETIEWEQNLAGIKALLNYYGGIKTL